ncbi:protein translocase subunit SecD [bacterium c-19]|nr:protein translocase subunit SecD [bacterium c-19]
MKKSRLTVFGITVLAILAIIIAFFGDIRDNMRLGLDLKGGFEILYEITPLSENDELPSMEAVVRSISKRVNTLGVNEPVIQVEGDNRVRVQLADVHDPEAARRMISSTANLTFRDVDDKLLMDAKVLQEGSASLAYDEYGRAKVSLKLADQSVFRDVTETISQRGSGQNLIVAWLDFDEATDSYAKQSTSEDPKYISAATVSQTIDSPNVEISGNFSEDEARELADLINSGSLPVKMNEVYSNAVSADYGIDAFSKTMLAGGIGVALIMLFMIAYYRLPGVISAITIAAYVFIVFLVYNAMGAVFTLSGIAALVLGVGMACDSNILTFERIKDAMHSGRSVKTAFYEGSSKSFTTILDAQLTTFISALILYMFGTGSVKGFATMLIISVFTTMVVIVFVAKFLLKLLVESGMCDGKYAWFAVKQSDVPDVMKGEERRQYGRFAKFDFVAKAKYFIYTSLAILAVAVCFMGFNGFSGNGILNLGIDFTSGTKLQIESDKEIAKDQLSAQLQELGIKANSIKINGEQNNIASVFSKDAIDTEVMEKAKTSLGKTYNAEVSDNVVQPIIGRELVRNAIIISVLAWIGVLIYVSVRFKWDYALSGIVALIHDVFIILAVCAILRMEINTDIIAVMLAIIGYSINNSIVVFDRIRDNVRLHKHEKLTPEIYKTIVNDALQSTFARSILSTFTTLLPVVCLLLMGSGAITSFNLTLCVGLLAGAGSSVFIAAQLWYYIRIHMKPKKKKAKRKKVDDIEELIVPGVND